MGNTFSFWNSKVGDALPDANHIDHEPVQESGSDSEYESCVEDIPPNTLECNENISSLPNIPETDLNLLEKLTENTKKYHYNVTSECTKMVILPCDQEVTPGIEGSLMEDAPSSSDDVNDSEDIFEESDGEKEKPLSKKCKIADHHQSMLTENEEFSSVLADPAGGDTQPNGTLYTAWEIDMTQKPETSKPVKARVIKRKKKKAIRGDMPDLSGVSNDVLAERKVMDLRRWHCISRPQYKKSCGISSVVSVWNYLYSTIGTGDLPPISQEEALYCLGFKPPFEEIRFGPFTGNATLMRWFRRLNDHYKVCGRAYYLYKPKGRLRTRTMTDESALRHLKAGLVDEGMGFIYHCLNHYFCPIGYEDTPLKPTQAYLPRGSAVTREVDNCTDLSGTVTQFNTWIMIGEPSRCHPPIHCKKWTDILQDLLAESPDYFDIRHTYKGMQQRKTKKKGRNLHCIIAFKKFNAP